MATAPATPLTKDELHAIDAWWRAANYLSVGQIYLLDNPLLRQPLAAEHVKPRLLGHWGTTPGLNFLYAHLNRAIRARDLDMIYIMGPGHGGPAAVANAYMEGTLGEVYPALWALLQSETPTPTRSAPPTSAREALTPRQHASGTTASSTRSTLARCSRSASPRPRTPPFPRRPSASSACNRQDSRRQGGRRSPTAFDRKEGRWRTRLSTQRTSSSPGGRSG